MSPKSKARRYAPRRPRSITWGSDLLVWIQAQCEPRPAPYPYLETPCAIWQRVQNRRRGEPEGYGQTKWSGRHWLVHRLTLALATGCDGPEDVDGQPVLHRCDRPACCEPSHLYFGTHRDNVADRQSRGPGNRGDANGMARLTAAQVREARRLHARGQHTFTDLADRYGVGRTTIMRAVRGHHWSNVDGLEAT